MISAHANARKVPRWLAILLVFAAANGCAHMTDPKASPDSSATGGAAQRSAAEYPCEIDPALRERIVQSLHKSYERFEPAAFERAADGSYPPLGPGRTQATLDWLYPAVHLTLEPRPGRERADRDLARKVILRCIRQGQFRRAGHAADGVWFWHFHDGENAPPGDRNTPGFMGCALVRIWAFDRRKMSDWPAGELAEFKEAVRASVEASIRLPVRIGYANPQVLDFFLHWVAADLLGDGSIRDHAQGHLREFLAYAATTDTFEEYVSPTYMAVNLSAGVPLAWYTKGTADEAITQDLLGRIWRQIGAAAHGPTEELCGPHARAYGDTAIGMSAHMYAWLHLAAPQVFTVPQEGLGQGGSLALIQRKSTMYDGLPAPGLYVPLGVPADVERALRDRFETPVQSRELLEWVGRCAWWPPYDLSVPDPAQPAPRFRIATRYRTSRFCLGSVNEQDAWLQRRSVLAYWKDAGGATTGLKWHVRFDIEGATKENLGDWMFMESIELISLQSGAEVIGAYRTAPIVPAKPGDVLACPARVFGPGKADLYVPRDPIGWLLGTHWRQSIERPIRHQQVKRLFVGMTPIGAGRWQALDAAGTRWAFGENGIEAVVETPAGARLVRMDNRTGSDEPVECLQLYGDEDIEWDWLNVPNVFAPFGLIVQDLGRPRRFGLQASGGPQACELQRGDLRLKWVSPSRPDRVTDRAWWGWVGGREVLPAGYVTSSGPP
jgi:hypothetical protein